MTEIFNQGYYTPYYTDLFIKFKTVSKIGFKFQDCQAKKIPRNFTYCFFTTTRIMKWSDINIFFFFKSTRTYFSLCFLLDFWHEMISNSPCLFHFTISTIEEETFTVLDLFPARSTGSMSRGGPTPQSVSYPHYPQRGNISPLYDPTSLSLVEQSVDSNQLWFLSWHLSFSLLSSSTY